MLRTRLFTMALIVLLAFGAIAPALGATAWTHVYAEDAVRHTTPSLALSAGAASAGDTIAVSGWGFIAGDSISLRIVSLDVTGVHSPAQAVAADAAGTFTASITIPLDATDGAYQVVARGLAIGDIARAPLTLVPAASGVGDTQTATDVPVASATPSATATTQGGDGSSDTPSATPTPVASATTTQTATATPTATDVPSATATPTTGSTATATEPPAQASATATTSDAGGSTVRTRSATIAASPSSFSPRSTIAVSGSGFAAGEQIALSLNAPDGSSAIALGAVQADANGAIVPTAVHIPFGAAPGGWLLQATGVVSNLQATFPVTVNAQTPTLGVAPATVAPPAPVSITGAHFQPNETVSVDIVTVAATIHLGSGAADAGGAITLTGLALPATLPGGTITVVATGLTSHLTASAQCSITAQPAGLRADRTTIQSGTGLTLEGSGFIAGETVSIVLDGGPQAPLALVEAVVAGSGTFSGLRVIVPAVTPAGAYMVTAAGLQSGRQAAIRLLVRAPHTHTPMLGIVSQAAVSAQGFQTNPGALVQVAGSHFPRNAPVTLRLVGTSRGAVSLTLAHSAVLGGHTGSAAGAAAGQTDAAYHALRPAAAGATILDRAATTAEAAARAPTATLVTLRADANGNLGPAGVALPATLAAGSYTVQAMVGGDQVASTGVRLRALHPQVALSPRALAPGRTFTVRGVHFAPGEQVVLALNSRALATSPRTVLTDRGGSFTAHFVAPTTLAAGSNALTASGVASRVSATTAVQAHLPPSAHWYFADGDTTSGHGTTMSLVNPNGQAASVHLTFLYQGAPSRSYALRLRAHAHTQLNLARIAGAGRLFSTILDADQRIGALSAIAYGAHIVTTTLGAPAPATQWYLAEGYTGGTFREYLKIMNTNGSFATVDVRFLPFNGRPPKNERFVVRPRSAIQVDVRRYMPLASVGSIVTADKGIVVSRTMRFGAGSRGAHQTIGSTEAATVWLFGQGNTAVDRQTFLTVANLNEATTAIVTATFLDAHGQPLATHTIFIQPLRRGNIKLNDLLPHAQTSVVLTSNVPVVAERSQYEGSPNLDHAYSGSVLLGCNSGSNTWLFPNATTAPGENTQIYLFNPSLTPDHIQVTFYTDGGRMINKQISIPVDASALIDVSQVRDLPGSAVGMQLSSPGSQVFVAEQSGDNSDFQSVSASAGIP